MNEKAMLDLKKLAAELSVDGPAKHKAKLILQRTAALVGAPGADDARKKLAEAVANFLAATKVESGRRIHQQPLDESPAAASCAGSSAKSRGRTKSRR